MSSTDIKSISQRNQPELACAHHMLEDDFTYVIRKAFKGLALSPGEAAVRAGLAERDVLAFSRGDFSVEIARKLAPVLGLNPDALADHDHYHPQPITLTEISRLDLPFGDERVNAWLVKTNGAAILFDTGYERDSCLLALGGTRPDEIFITHGHSDHIGGNRSFVGIPMHGPDISNTMPVAAGDTYEYGKLSIRAVDLSGHYMPQLGYLIEGLALPVLVTGDALFAGSMGGCPTPELYQHALSRLHEELARLPDSTVLLPGHGPATTLGEERRSNPFLPGH
jgi:hydroxyacylglutathione hydrolase